MTTVTITLWLMCAVATGMLGQSKGRRFADFFIIGLLLGVLGVVYGIFAKRRA